MIAAAGHSALLIELGLVLLVLALMGRLAGRLGIPSIPLYLLSGLLMGEGGAVPLDASGEFIGVAAELGVVLLLLLLGLEYRPDDLRDGLTSNWPAGLIDMVANFVPGWLAGTMLGWPQSAAVLLGGITYVSSSGIIARLLADLDRYGNRETPVVLSILVIEDIAMAALLPLTGVLLVDASPLTGLASAGGAIAIVAAALLLSLRWGTHLSRAVDTSTEPLLLTVLGLTFFVGGIAEELQISAAIGAFLLGLALSGRVAERGRDLLHPIRDVFGGLFFVFFSIQIAPDSLVSVLLPAAALGVVTAATKYTTGWWAARRAGIGRGGMRRAGVMLVPRGEFSIVLAGIGMAAGVEADLGPLAACYVLLMAVGGSLLARFVGEPQGPQALRRAPL